MLLSVQQFETNAANAVAFLDAVALKLKDILRESPEEEHRIVTNAAFDELRARFDVVARFPQQIGALFSDYDSFPIFSILRSTHVPSHVVAAYMIRVDVYANLAPASIAGRLVPLDTAAIYASGRPACSSDITVELAELRQQLQALTARTQAEMATILNRQQQATDAAAQEVNAALSAASRTNSTRQLLISAFSHHSVVVQKLQTNKELSQAMEVIARLGNAIYQAMLSREDPYSAALYARYELGTLQAPIPDSYAALMKASRRDLDSLSIVGGRTFHNMIGQRWMLLRMSEDRLLRYSQYIDSRIASIFSSIPESVQVEVTTLFAETFPTNFVFEMAGRGYASLRDIPIQRQLFERIVEYTKLTTTIKNALKIVMLWWSMKLAELVKLKRLTKIRQLVSAVKDYDAVARRLEETQTVEAYEALFVDTNSFSRTVGLLFEQFATMSSSITRNVFESPGALTAYLLSIGDYNAYQKRIFDPYLKAQINTVNGMIKLDQPYSSAVLTDVRSLLAVARRHPQTISNLLSSQRDTFFFNDLNEIDDALPMFTMPTASFAVLFPVWRETSPGRSIFDILVDYYARVRLYYAVKWSPERIGDGANAYEEFIRSLRRSDGGLVTVKDALTVSEQKVAWDAKRYNKVHRRIVENVKLASIVPNSFFRTSPFESKLQVARATLVSIAKYYFTGQRIISSQGLNRVIVGIFDVLDIAQGGTVTSAGMPRHTEAPLYKSKNATFFSLYMVCLLVYVELAQADPVHPGTAAFDAWRYTVDYFDSYQSNPSPELVGARVYRSFDMKNTEVDPLSSNTLPAPNVGITLPQYVIPSFGGPSFEAIVYGEKQYYTALKYSIYDSLRDEVKTVVRSWLSANELQKPCVVGDLKETWLLAKHAILSLNDPLIAAHLYYTTVCASINVAIDQVPANKIYTDFVNTRMGGSEIGWGTITAQIVACKTWMQDMLASPKWNPVVLDEISALASASNTAQIGDTMDVRTYNEFSMVHSWHFTQQTEIMLKLARHVQFTGKLAARDQTNIRAQAAKTSRGSFANLVSNDTLTVHFSQLLSIEEEDTILVTSLRALFSDSKSSADQLLAVFFFTLTCIELDVRDNDQLIALLSAEQPPNNYKIAVLRRVIIPLIKVTETFNQITKRVLENSDRVAMFTQAVDLSVDAILDVLFKGAVAEPTTRVADDAVDAALAVVYETYLTALSSEYALYEMHKLHRYIIEDVCERAFAALGKDEINRSNFIKHITEVRNSNDYAAVAKKSLFFSRLTPNALKRAYNATDNFKAPIIKLCDAFIMLANYASYTAAMQGYVLQRVTRELCAGQRIPPGRLLGHFMESSTFETKCITLDTFANPGQLPKYLSSDFPEKFHYIVDVNAALPFKLTQLVTWSYYFTHPAIIHAVYALEFFRSINPHSYDEGWRRRCAQAARTAPTIIEGIARYIDEQIGDGFVLDALYRFLEGALATVAKTAQRHEAAHVLWDETLRHLSANLQSWGTRSDLLESWQARAIKMSQQESYSLMDAGAKAVAAWLRANIKKTFDEQLVEDSSLTTCYRVFVKNNVLLTDYGPHRVLASVFAR